MNTTPADKQAASERAVTEYAVLITAQEIAEHLGPLIWTTAEAAFIDMIWTELPELTLVQINAAWAEWKLRDENGVRIR